MSKNKKGRTVLCTMGYSLLLGQDNGDGRIELLRNYE